MKSQEEMWRMAVWASICRRIFTIITLVLCITLLGLTLWAYLTLPDSVPTHFDLAGNITSWGGKGVVWLLPAFVLPVIPLTFLLVRNESLINTPYKITERNRMVQVALARAFLAVINACIMLSIILVQLMIVAGAKGSLGIWGLASLFGLALLLAVTVFYFVIARRYR